MPCAFVFVLLLAVGWSTVHCEACICTRTGVSNGVETGTSGCVLQQGAETPTCFVESSSECERANPSAEFPGASFVNCSVEDALFYAAETDDVESIMRFRELGESLKVWSNLNTTVFENNTLPLLFHAAAYGSFRVLEDVLINRDFDCIRPRSPRAILCEFSRAAKCDVNDTGRVTLNMFIDRAYDNGCIYSQKTIPATPGEPTSFQSVQRTLAGTPTDAAESLWQRMPS